ncbi:MAG: LysR family transcriptional regulator [Hydrogenophaga sp.]|uniref:LysR family transcriptional regulator n=1 Tax=Hydrogenophaga sp. TaxID=1904254 RepID=UPI001D2890B7|nr:LysR family transcriptional regulator [Hydrogenophaga sp.]MBX3611493.1 LysR family transcriptional regulator [Hydrogenophaga sp.]
MSAIDIRQLALLVALYEKQNLTSAAEALHMTPSAASQSLQRLRQAVADELVVRENGAYLATPVGEYALEAFRDILRLWEDIGHGHASFSPADAPAHWRIAYAEDFNELDINACYASLVAAAPRSRIDLLGMDEGIWQELRAARVDLALSAMAPPDDAADLHAVHVADCELSHCCLSVAHPRIRSSLDLTSFATESHAGLASAEAGLQGQALDAAPVDAGLSSRRLSTVAHLQQLAVVIATTDRLASVSHRQGVAMLRLSEGLRLLPLPPALPRTPLSRFMVWHHRDHQVAGHRWLREQIKQHLNKRSLSEEAPPHLVQGRAGVGDALPPNPAA